MLLYYRRFSIWHFFRSTGLEFIHPDEASTLGVCFREAEIQKKQYLTLHKNKMLEQLKQSLWSQFGASIDTLEQAIKLCPEALFTENKRLFYITFHTLIFLDYYLTIPPRNFSSPLPYTITNAQDLPENAIDDLVPDRFYSKTDMLHYLLSSRNKCHQLILGLTEEKIQNERFIEAYESGAMNYAILEILLYNMRHVQHHAAQLNLLLRMEINNAPKWVSRANNPL